MIKNLKNILALVLIIYSMGQNSLFSQYYGFQHIAIIDSLLVPDSIQGKSIDLAPELINVTIQNPNDSISFPGGGQLILSQHQGNVLEDGDTLEYIINASLDWGIFKDTLGNQFLATFTSYPRDIAGRGNLNDIFEFDFGSIIPQHISHGDSGRIIFSNVFLPAPTDSTIETNLDRFQVLEQRANDSIIFLGVSDGGDSIITFNMPFIIGQPNKSVRWYGFPLRPGGLLPPLLTNTGNLLGTSLFGYWADTITPGQSSFAGFTIPQGISSNRTSGLLIGVGIASTPLIIFGIVCLLYQPCLDAVSPPNPNPNSPKPFSLPIGMIDFYARQLDNKVLISGKVFGHSGTSINYSVVRRNLEDQDSTVFPTIQGIQEEEFVDFQLIDPYPKNGLNIYELYEVIDEDEYILIGQVHLNFEIPGDFISIAIYPTIIDAENKVYLRIEEHSPYKGNYNFELFDMLGRLILSKNIPSSSGFHIAEINLPLIGRGTYRISLRSEKRAWTSYIIK